MPPRKKAAAAPKQDEELVNEVPTTGDPTKDLSPEEFGKQLKSGELEATPESIIDPNPEFTPKEDAEDLEAAENATGDTVPLAEVEAELQHLEPLELEDLVDDNNRVRMAANLFPLDIGEDTKVRLYMIAVPGEEDTLAVVWFKNTPTGPQQAVPVRRITSQTENGFTTEDGETYSYTTSKGCKTCGNPLFTYRPWGGHVRVTQMSTRR